MEALIDESDYEWLMIDASHCKVHPHVASAQGGNQDMSRTKGGSIPKFTLPWIHLVCRSELEGTRADCKEGIHLIQGISAENLLAGRGYDTYEIISYAVSSGMYIVISPKRNRKNSVNMVSIFIKLDILLKMPFFG